MWTLPSEANQEKYMKEAKDNGLTLDSQINMFVETSANIQNKSDLREALDALQKASLAMSQYASLDSASNEIDEFLSRFK